MWRSALATIFIAFSNPSEIQTAMKIIVKSNGNITVFELNESPAAKDLYEQLPLRITTEKYGDNEVIFYPPRKLTITKHRQRMLRGEHLHTMRPGVTS